MVKPTINLPENIPMKVTDNLLIWIKCGYSPAENFRKTLVNIEPLEKHIVQVQSFG